jgi:hypothetical protein
MQGSSLPDTLLKKSNLLKLGEKDGPFYSGVPVYTQVSPCRLAIKASNSVFK